MARKTVKQVSLDEWLAGVGDDVWLFSDGARHGAKGAHGGWGFVLGSNGIRFSDFGGLVATTSSRAELTAVILGLSLIPGTGRRVSVHTDAQWMVDEIPRLAELDAGGWITDLNRRNAGRYGPRRMRNRDLWAILFSLVQRHDTRFQWVRGHAGDARNEEAHTLAQRGVEMAKFFERGVNFKLDNAVALAKSAGLDLP